MTLMPLSLVLRGVKAGYELGKGVGRLNHLLYTDDLKLYGKDENQLETLLNTVYLLKFSPKPKSSSRGFGE